MMTVEPVHDAVARVRDSFRTALDSEPAYREMLPFFKSVYELQEAAAATVRPGKLDALAEGAGGTRPLARRGHIPLDRSAAVHLLQDLLAAARGANRTLAEAAALLQVYFEEDGARPARCFRLFLEQDQGGLMQLSDTIGITPALLEIFLYNSVWPSLAYHVRRLTAEGEYGGEPYGGTCPLCGALPDISFLEDNGQRSLACGFCRHQWPVPRIQCPCCNNTDAETIGYHYSDDDHSRRIDTCDRCGGYWITIDTRRLARPFYAPLEALVATHLQIKAEKMGYRRPEDAGNSAPVAETENAGTA